MRSTGRLVGRLRCTLHCQQCPVALAGSPCIPLNEIDQWQNRSRPVFCFQQSDDSPKSLSRYEPTQWPYAGPLGADVTATQKCSKNLDRAIDGPAIAPLAPMNEPSTSPAA
jgi:hypothetical protein